MKEYKTYEIERFKNSEEKRKLIEGDKYDFIRFCQNASTETIAALLDEEGIEMLLNSDDAEYKVSGRSARNDL